jgi:cytochrome c oxidase assembly factor CtaG
VPQIMTFEGWNFDIIIGLSAIAMLAWRWYSGKGISRRFYRIWNIAGIVFLTIIVTIAILSAPSPIQQLGFGQPNTAVSRFPYVLLPALVVPLVLLSHLLGLKSTGRKNMYRPGNR